MDAAVLIAGLAAPFLLKRNPRLAFRTHSNLAKPFPLPLGGLIIGAHLTRAMGDGDKRSAWFGR
jgi:hypothetical protein